ncbi:MAG: VOC family protein [Chloroflexi bacterium]|nr:VOC family protein [Chloroflexota bacterium]
MKISVTSVSVGDQAKALAFYTEKLGFIKKHDIPIGDARWLTVVSPEAVEGVELLLEPNASYPAMKALKEALVNDGIPFTTFEVKDVYAEYNRLKALGVTFTFEPTDMGTTIVAILDDTCGNLIQIHQIKPGSV